MALHDGLKINGEAIYNTHPRKIYGDNFSEQPKKEKGEEFHDLVFDGTPKEIVPDLRFTAKEDSVYVFARSIKENNFTIKSITKEDKIENIKLLGDCRKIKWKMLENGLNIKIVPMSKSKVPVRAFKIEFKK